MELRCWIDSSVARRGGKCERAKWNGRVMCLFWCRIWNGSWKWIHLLWCWGYIELFLFVKEINKWNYYLWFFLKFCFFLALIFIMLVYYNDWIIFAFQNRVVGRAIVSIGNCIHRKDNMESKKNRRNWNVKSRGKWELLRSLKVVCCRLAGIFEEIRKIFLKRSVRIFQKPIFLFQNNGDVSLYWIYSWEILETKINRKIDIQQRLKLIY